jgi:hypothetical protein
MAYNDEPIPPNRSNFRVILGVLMVAFSIYRLFMLIRILPALFERGDTT